MDPLVVVAAISGTVFYFSFGIGIAMGLAGEVVSRRTPNWISVLLVLLSVTAWPAVLTALAGGLTIAGFVSVFRRIMDGAGAVEVPNVAPTPSREDQ